MKKGPLVHLVYYTWVKPMMVGPTFLCSILYNVGSFTWLYGPVACEFATFKNRELKGVITNW